MARKRMLDPMLWDDPDLAALTPLERLLFIGMISFADDYGHVSGNPALLRKWVFGYDNITVAEVKEMRDHILAYCRNAALYSVHGQAYIWLRTWNRHQDLRFRGPAQYPCHACGDFHNADNYKDCVGKPMDSAMPVAPVAQDLRSDCVAPTQDLPPDYVTLDNVTLDQDISWSSAAPVGAEKQIKSPRKDSRKQGEAPPDGFAEFWVAYPLKKAKSEAETAYRRQLKGGARPESLITGAGNYALQCRLRGTEPDYISYPATFLNKRRYEDYQQAPDVAAFAPRIIGNSRDKQAMRAIGWVDRSRAYDPARDGC